MAWFLQTPSGASPSLIKQIVRECGSATKGAAAFAFASALGVKLLTAEPEFKKFLKASVFLAVIGLDAITDTKAVEELQKVQKKYPNFKPKLFLHSRVGSCFHPKTMWLKTANGGVIITGSGNLTLGGLMANWEATAVEKLSVAEMNAAEAVWDKWLKAHQKQLLDLDDSTALDKAKANKIQRTKIKKTLKLPEAEDEAAEVAADAAEEVTQELLLNPVLIAEVPKGGNRWNQVNFDVQTFQQYFGVTLGSTKVVHFYHMHDDGTLAAREDRHAVAVKSQNYRFEVGAAHGLPYPASGHPIVIFEKIADSTFKYVLLMPGQPAHKLVQNYLDDNYAKTRGKRRITIAASDLQRVWPQSPLFL
jgi:hypothetical protein